MLQMVSGVQQYQQTSLPQEETPHRVIWRKANAKLLDYGGTQSAPALLCIPSLINRASIFDLYPQRSFVRRMRKAGLRVLVLNWDAPGAREKRYGMSEYVNYLLLEALQHLRSNHTGSIHLLGYCMGGLLALAAAQLRPHMIDSLTLLATPFARMAAPPLNEPQWQQFEDFIRAQDALHPAITQTLFHLLDPWHFQEKFARYGALSSADKTHFAHVERWVNDGVALSRYVARECYIRWPREDYFASHLWRVGGQAIRPEKLQVPALCICPSEDKIVPLASSQPLAQRIWGAQSLTPQSGHISLLVGRRSQSQLITPLAQWIGTHTQN